MRVTISPHYCKPETLFIRTFKYVSLLLWSNVKSWGRRYEKALLTKPTVSSNVKNSIGTPPMPLYSVLSTTLDLNSLDILWRLSTLRPLCFWLHDDSRDSFQSLPFPAFDPKHLSSTQNVQVRSPNRDFAMYKILPHPHYCLQLPFQKKCEIKNDEQKNKI